MYWLRRFMILMVTLSTKHPFAVTLWHQGIVQECVWKRAVKADMRGTVTWAVKLLTPCDVIWHHGFPFIFIQLIAFGLFTFPQNNTHQANLPWPHDRTHGHWATCVIGPCLPTISAFSQSPRATGWQPLSDWSQIVHRLGSNAII